jgi:hypothetical protein
MALNNGKQRIQLDLTERQFEAIKRVQSHIDCNSYSEVFRRALVLMDKIIALENEKKVEFGVLNEDRTFTHIWIV